MSWFSRLERAPLPTGLVTDVAARLDPELGRMVEFRRWLRPILWPGIEDLSTTAFVPDRLLGNAGIELNEADQVSLIESFGIGNEELFDRIRTNPKINTKAPGEPLVRNGQYPSPDAEIYGAMIRWYQPTSIIEVGAGFSTRIARTAIETGLIECELWAVDPEPRTDVVAAVDRHVRAGIEDVDLKTLPLSERTLLLIDSSHVLTAQGDVARIYTELIPALSAGALVHVHDIYTPWDYPDYCRRRLYTEQYVLHALLAHSPRYRVVLSTHYLVRRHTALMRRLFGSHVGEHPEHFAGTLWFTT